METCLHYHYTLHPANEVEALPNYHNINILALTDFVLLLKVPQSYISAQKHITDYILCTIMHTKIQFFATPRIADRIIIQFIFKTLLFLFFSLSLSLSTASVFILMYFLHFSMICKGKSNRILYLPDSASKISLNNMLLSLITWSITSYSYVFPKSFVSLAFLTISLFVILWGHFALSILL